MATLKYFNSSTGLWEYAALGAQGSSGVVSATAPLYNDGNPSAATLRLDQTNFAKTNVVTTFTNTTESTSYSTGSLIISGGVGIAKNLYVQGNLVLTGNIDINGTITGNLTQINVADLNVTDSLIYLGSENLTSDTLDIGFNGAYRPVGAVSGHKHSGLARDHNDSGIWKLFSNADEITGNDINFGVSDANVNFDQLKLRSLIVTDASTTRTNLGLNTMALESTSNYLTTTEINTTYLTKSVVTTLGDLLYGSANATISRLAGSTTNGTYVLSATTASSVAGTPSWLATTGTGNIARVTSPTLATPVVTTSLQSTSTSFELLSNTVTTLNIGTIASINMGANTGTNTFKGATTIGGLLTALSGVSITTVGGANVGLVVKPPTSFSTTMSAVAASTPSTGFVTYTTSSTINGLTYGQQITVTGVTGASSGNFSGTFTFSGYFINNANIILINSATGTPSFSGATITSTAQTANIIDVQSAAATSLLNVSLTTITAGLPVSAGSGLTVSNGKLATATTALAYASLNLPASASVTPTSPVVGDLWTSGTSTGALNFYTGAATKTLAYSDGTNFSLTNPLSVATGGTGLSTFGSTAGVLKTDGSNVLSASTIVGADISTSTTVRIAGLGVGVAAPSTGVTISGGKTTFAATTTSYASLTLPSTVVVPSSTVQGDLYSGGPTSDLYYVQTTGAAAKKLAYTDGTITGNAANVTGTVAIANGGTGAITAAAARGALAAEASAYPAPISGGYYGFPKGAPFTTSTVTSTLNRMFFVAMPVSATTTFVELATNVTVLAAGSTAIRMGIYGSQADGRPFGLPLADTGITVNGTTIGAKQATLIPAVTLTPGMYHLAIVQQGAAATTTSWSGPAAWLGYPLTVVQPSTFPPSQTMSWFIDSVNGALPNILSAPTSVNPTMPAVLAKAQ